MHRPRKNMIAPVYISGWIPPDVSGRSRMLARQVLLAGLTGVSLLAPFGRSDEFDFFESEVRPVLAQHCYKCHGAKQQKGGIRLDEPKHLANAGDGAGPLVVPGDPEQSRLIQAVQYTDEPKMPPAGKLPDHAIDALKQWVKKGAALAGAEGTGGSDRGSLGFQTRPCPVPAHGKRKRLARDRDRPLHSRAAGSQETESIADRRPANLDSQNHL